MTQTTFADLRARRSDPATSKVAAAHVERSGKGAKQQAIAFDCVYRWPGKTSAELAQLSGELDRYTMARRLPEVRRRGLIRNGEDRKCEVTKCKAMTWEAV